MDLEGEGLVMLEERVRLGRVVRLFGARRRGRTGEDAEERMIKRRYKWT